MSNCIFCQIAAGESPCYKIYEDKEFIAFLDIYPRVKGHVLLIPKKHYRWIYDVPHFGKYWEAALKITKALQKALNPEFVNYVTYGIDIPHAHIHILPRTYGKAYVPEIQQIPKEQMEDVADKIRKEI
jgi:histidine triad (HIT) family protein